MVVVVVVLVVVVVVLVVVVVVVGVVHVDEQSNPQLPMLHTHISPPLI